MGRVVAYNDGWRLWTDARLVVDRGTAVLVIVCCCSERIRAGQRARGKGCRVHAGKLLVDVAAQRADRQSARHHGRSCLAGQGREAVARRGAAEGASGEGGAVDDFAPVAASLRGAAGARGARGAALLGLVILLVVVFGFLPIVAACVCARHVVKGGGVGRNRRGRRVVARRRPAR